jgi:hypothetical protein
VDRNHPSAYAGVAQRESDVKMKLVTNKFKYFVNAKYLIQICIKYFVNAKYLIQICIKINKKCFLSAI